MAQTFSLLAQLRSLFRTKRVDLNNVVLSFYVLVEFKSDTKNLFP